MSNRATKVLSDLSAKTTIDNKLTHAALMLNYAFEYGVNFKERIINITGDIDEAQFDRLDVAMTEMEAQSKATITIKINSAGGYVYQALAMIGRMKKSKCKIVTEGYGEVMSAATLLLAGGDTRKISRYCMFMHHESHYGTEGRHSQNIAAVKQAEREEKLWAQWMAEFTTKDEKFWKKTGTNVDAYFTADQLVELGVADEVF